MVLQCEIPRRPRRPRLALPCHAHRHLPACFRVQSRLPPRQGEGCALCPLPLGRLGRHLAQGTAPSQDDTLRATQEDNLFNLGMVYFILNSSIFNAVLISGSFIYVNSCSQNFKCQCPFSHTPLEWSRDFCNTNSECLKQDWLSL